MENKGMLTKILAVTGTLLAWFPILATVLTSAFGSIRRGTFLMDYLMPAELFPVAVVGAGLLLWAAMQARSRRGLIGWGLVSMLALLVGSQALAAVTGLASGETEPTGWPWALVITGLAGYIVMLIATGVGGILLVRELFAGRPGEQTV